MVRDTPFESGTYSLASIGSNAPELYEAVERAFREAGCFSDMNEFVNCSLFWDAVDLMDEWGLDPTTAHAGQVICRECAEVLEEPLGDHLAAAHSMTVEAYRAEHPVAPVSPEERAELPPAGIEWRTEPESDEDADDEA